MKYALILFFLVLNQSLFANKASAPAISQWEVIMWGVIFLCLSLGSLLLVVYLFPKNEIYKKQKMDRESRKFEKLRAPVVAQKPVAEVQDKTTMTNLTAAPVSESLSQHTEPPKKETTQHTIHTELPKTDPSRPSIPVISVKPQVTPPTPPPVPQATAEIRIASNDFLFKSKNSEVEGMCREFLSKLLVLVPCKSISIYFVKNGQFTRYIERKGDALSLYDPVTERADISEEVIKFLKKKLGAFSSTHADAVLPLVQGDQLFGAVKLLFTEPQKNFNINPVWSEIKSFAKFFQQTFQPTVAQEKDALYSIEHFNNILSYRVTLDISQNLTLIKVVNATDKPKATSLIGETLKDILGKKPEIYKVSEDTVGIFLTIEAREKLGKSLSELLTKLRKQVKTVDLCVGSVDYNSNFKFPQKWYEKAQQALGEATQAGPNNYKLLVEKT